MQPKSWFAIRSKSATAAEIDIFDEIGFWGVSAKAFVTQLRALSGLKQITLNIDSPGGDCNDGFTIYDAIQASGAQVTANITGMAASMASVIMLAAKTINIAENGRVMVHRVTSGGCGNADDLDAVARTARQFEDRIVALYIARTGATESAVRDWMKASDGTWFFGQEAVEAGFADSIITGTKARAFRTEWAGLFTMLPSALFDTRRSTDIQELMKLTDAQKTRLHALLRNASLTEAEKTELQTLSDAAKKESYDAAVAILREDSAAAAAQAIADKAAADKLAAEAAAKALTPEQHAAITAAVTTGLKSLQDRMDKAETIIRAGIHTSAGGRKAVDTGTGDGGPGDSEQEKLAQAYFGAAPAARSKMLRDKGVVAISAATAAFPQKKA